MKMSNTNKIIVHVDADLEPIIPRFFQLRYEDIDSINKGLEHDLRVERDKTETLPRLTRPAPDFTPSDVVRVGCVAFTQDDDILEGICAGGA